MRDQPDRITCMKTQSSGKKNVGFVKVTTEEQALAAIKKTYIALKYIPKKFKTAELCFIAVHWDSRAIKYVPKKLITDEIYFEAVKQNGRVLKYVPEELRTVKLCLVAVQNDGWAIEYVPKELKTMKLCLAAVQNQGRVLVYVPQRFRTTELCISAIKNDIFSMEYVLKRSQTKEVISTLIKQLETDYFTLPKNYVGRLLSYVSEKYRSEFKNKIMEIYGIDEADINYWLAYCQRLLVKKKWPATPVIDFYSIAIRLYPKSPELYRARGRVYQLIKKEKKAQADFSKARKLGHYIDDKAKK